MQLSIQEINNLIYTIRDTKVMLDRDLSQLYQVNTKVLNQSVKRNIDRFPEDFMFQLTDEEFVNWRSQFVTSKSDKQGLRRPPYAFTEHGILMLSSVLRSQIAVEVNIQIMRTFVALRKYALTHDELAKRIENLEQRVNKGENIDKHILDVVNELMRLDIREGKRIGFL